MRNCGLNATLLLFNPKTWLQIEFCCQHQNKKSAWLTCSKSLERFLREGHPMAKAAAKKKVAAKKVAKKAPAKKAAAKRR
jgi:hypothetical protein